MSNEGAGESKTEVTTSASSASQNIKRGDYQVHFFLEEGRSLMAKEEQDTVDPIVNITVFGKKKYTKALDDVGGTAAVYWGQHFFWTENNLEKEDVENARILIEVKDHRFMLKDSLIGSYEMDLTYVYFQDKHSLIHKWICLANSESKEFESVRGYLKFGVSVLAVGDEQVDLAIKEKGEMTDSDLLLPPQIQTEACQMVIRCVKGEGLPKLDSGSGTCDPYVMAIFSGLKMKTKHQECDSATFSAYWYEDIYIPVTLPNVSGKLLIRLWDWDAGLNSDDIIGGVSFNWANVLAGKYADYFWANIYGSHIEGSGPETDRMNNLPEVASYWRGRVLMRITTEKIKKPSTKVEKIDEEGFDNMVRGTYEAGQDYELRAQVFSAVALPERYTKYSIQVRWGDSQTQSASIDGTNAACDFYETLSRKICYFPPLKDAAELPDIFVYLMHQNDPICYTRVKAKDWMDPHCKAIWMRLHPDKALGYVKNDWEGGYVRIRIFGGVFQDNEDSMDSGNWRNHPQKPSPAPKILNCNLYQCKHLPAADSNALADPYVVFYCGGQKVQTLKDERMETLNPMWYRTLPLELHCDNIFDAPPVIVYVYDYDQVGDNDLLGMTVLTLDEASMNDPQPKRPHWCSLNMGKPGSELGEILISFNLYDTTNIPHYDLMPACEETTVEINVLGLRDLKPPLGWVPVNKAFVKFDLNSLQLPGEQLAVRNVQTQPAEPGSNPNINTIIKISIKMPLDPLFCPALTASVYDYLFKGLSQPLIGTFALDLGKIFYKEKVEQHLKILDLSKTLKTEPVKRPAPKSKTVFEETITPVSKDIPIASKPPPEATSDTPPFVQTSVTLEEEKIEKPKAAFNMSAKGLLDATAPKEEKKKAPALNKVYEEDVKAPVSEAESIELEEDLQNVGISAGVSRAPPKLMTEDLSLKGARKGTFVRMPEYQKNADSGRMEEINVPDPNYYMVVGYDKNPGDGVMHYRYIVKSELEESEYIDKSPFQKFDLLKGQERGLEDDNPFVSADSKNNTGQGSNLTVCGQFKGICRVTREHEVEQRKAKVAALQQRREKVRTAIAKKNYANAMMTFLSETEEEPQTDSDEDFEEMTKKLLLKNECVIRVYVLDAFDLAQRDEDSLSDPYVLVKLGKKTVGDPKKYLVDQTNCGFFQIFDLETTLPGASLLKIELWDHDEVFSDELIGRTIIDLEDRFFSNKWQRIPNKPIETRTLWHKSTKLEQGTVRCWVDIIPKKEMFNFKKWDISPRPPAEFEARLIIWGTDDVANADIEGTSDIFIRAWVNEEEPKETDTHYRCQTGKGSFNWRMKWPVTIPHETYRVNIQIWDLDILSFNDFLADATFTYNKLAKDAWISNRRVKRDGPKDVSLFKRAKKEDDNKFWINCKRRNKKHDLEDGGKVQVSFELVPKLQAQACSVGEGRSDPNVDPFLPPPTGRLKFSWNPCTLMNQFCGPSFRAKIWCCCICILCCALFIYMIPNIFSNVVTGVLFDL